MAFKMCEGRCKHSAKGSLSFHQEHSPRQSWDECAVGSKTLFFLVSPLCGSGAWTHDLVISEQKCHIVSCHLLTRPKNGSTQFSFQMVDNSPCSCHLLNVWGKKSPLVPMSSDPYIYYVDTRVQNDKSEHQGQHPLSKWSLVYCVEEKLQKPEYYLHHCDQIYEVRFTDLWKVRLQTRVFESVHWHQVLFQFLSWAADRNEKPKLNVETIVCGRCRRNTNFDANIKRLYIYIYTAGGGGSPRGRQSGSLNWRKNSVSLW